MVEDGQYVYNVHRVCGASVVVDGRKEALSADGFGVTHRVKCGYSAVTVTGWSQLVCDKRTTAGVLKPGDVDALVPWSTCLWCAVAP